jgi:phage gp29-like protein
MATIPRDLLEPQAERRPHDPINHPGWGVTIDQVFRIYRQAELGRPAAQCDLFDDVGRRDGTLRGLVNSRRSAIAGRPVLVLPGAQDSGSMRIADMWSEVWDRLPRRAIVEHHQHGPNFFGWAASETEWAWNPWGDRRYDPIDFYHPRTRTFRIATEYNTIVADAAPDELLCRVGRYEHDVARMTPGKWIVTRRTQTERVATDSLMYTSTLYTVLRNNGWADWFVFMKRFGLPFPKVTVDDWSDENSRRIALEIVRSFGEDGGVVVPKNAGVNVEIIDAAQMSRNATSELHQRFVGEANLELAKLWNGAVLASETGGGSSSYALAKEHGGIRFELLQEDATRLQSSLQEHLIKPWMRFNGLDQAGVKAPKMLVFLTRVEDPEQAVKIAKMLAEIGVRVDPAHLLEITGLRGAEAEDDNEQETEE